MCFRKPVKIVINTNDILLAIFIPKMGIYKNCHFKTGGIGIIGTLWSIKNVILNLTKDDTFFL